MSVIIKLLSKFDDSGLKKAKRGFSGLTKTLGAVGIGLSLKSLTGDLVDAAKAASMDQKSTQLLNNQLIKNAKATTAQTKANDRFIQTLSEQVGIVDDELRPAQARLARATGSVKKSQDLLKLALDASAVSGKPLATVSAALGKAFNGSTGALIKLFPELKKSKDLFGDLRKEVEGTAAQQADPFAKLNVAMDNLKEKLGMTIMPIVLDFIDTMMKPDGAIEQVGKFLDDVSNPKTEAGKTFLDIKKAVMETIGGVKDFFALFGNGDAMKGFAVVAGNLIKALPALLALKGIMVLANSAKSIQNLILAMTAIAGKGGSPTNIIPGSGKGTPKLLGTGALLGAGMVLSLSGDTQLRPPQQKYNPKDYQPGGKFYSPVPSVVVNVHSADPKATVDAIGKYLKQNGSLPFNLATVGRG
jgi:hypothetical protein